MTICQSGRAWPGGSTALRTRWTRRSVLVNVPSTSANDAAGSTTSANSAVSVMNKSWTTRNSTASRARRVYPALASDTTVFSPMMYTPRILPSSIFSSAPTLVVPGWGLRFTPQADSQRWRASSELTLLVAGKVSRQTAHVSGPLDIVLAAEWVDARAEPAEVAGQQGQIRQGLHVVNAA